jgi:small subunit ribosomal protein S20
MHYIIIFLTNIHDIVRKTILQKTRVRRFILANHKSAIKRARQNDIRRLRNRAVKTRIKTILKDVNASAGGEGHEAANTQFKAAQSLIDKAAKKGVLHRRTAARKVSRLNKSIQRTPV